MVKSNRTIEWTIKFIIIIGIIVLIDAIIDITSIFNKLIQVLILKVFNLKIENINIYTSLYASIAVLLSSNLKIIKKLEYSIVTIIVYVLIFTFVTVYGISYVSYSLYLTLIVFITMTFPILLWMVLDKINK